MVSSGLDPFEPLVCGTFFVLWGNELDHEFPGANHQSDRRLLQRIVNPFVFRIAQGLIQLHAFGKSLRNNADMVESHGYRGSKLPAGCDGGSPIAKNRTGKNDDETF